MFKHSLLDFTVKSKKIIKSRPIINIHNIICIDSKGQTQVYSNKKNKNLNVENTATAVHELCFT